MSVASRLPLVGWLFPSPDEPGRAIAWRTQLHLVVSLTLANMVGAAVVFVFLGLVLPTPEIPDSTDVLLTNLVITAIYVTAGTIVGSLWGAKRLSPLRAWLRSDRPATERERETVLSAPYRIVGVHAVLWSVAAAAFGAYNWTHSQELGQRVVLTILLGGLTTCAIAYLLTERMLRPAAARALAEGVSGQTHVPGVKARALLAWLLGTGIPLVGLILVALSTIVEGDFNADELAVTAMALASTGIVIGFFVTTLAARAVADPVRGVREAVEEVERGKLDVEVPVYDGSELGQLQAGFNRMVAGLRERERINDLFGRHVGEDVARAALERDVELGGETLDVSVLFVDMVGSTKLASEVPPQDVVDTLNSFFAIVVDVVRRNGGWVNKFEGDAALAVFGAPVPLADHATRALAAARELHERLRGLDGVEAGIGVSSGEAVAGNIGEARRFEYTVIGDPVNEAARLTELAKSEGGVLASDAAIERATDDEASRWELGDAVELRGRTRPTRPAKPVVGGPGVGGISPPEGQPTPRVWLAGLQDLDAVAILIAEFRDHWGKSEPTTDEMRESAERILAAGDGEYLLGAVGDGEPSGVAQLRFRWSVWTSAEDCWLEDLFVRPATRRGGLGRALVEAAAARATERGCKRIELDTNEDNQAALALYEACGFSLEPKGSGRTLFLGRRLAD